jgi:hypothetical protein
MEGAACECSFLGPVEHEHLEKVFHHRSMAHDSDKLPMNQFTRLAPQEASAAQLWRTMVSRYSRLNLTMEKDIFPALSGLAKQINREIKDAYVAGLWKKSLPIDLLWQVSSHKNESQPQWRAPTWSWAHGKNPVDWVNDLNDRHKAQVHLKVWEAKQVPVGENEIGEISSASLVVRAQLCPATLVVYTPEPDAARPQADLVIDGV